MEELASILGTEHEYSSHVYGTASSQHDWGTCYIHVTCTGGGGGRFDIVWREIIKDLWCLLMHLIYPVDDRKSLSDTVSAIIKSVFLCFRKTTLVIV